MRADLSRPLPLQIRSEAASELGALGVVGPDEIVQHVLEELFQHRGQMEITRDLIAEQNYALGTSISGRRTVREKKPTPRDTSTAQSTVAAGGDPAEDVRFAARQLLDLLQVPLETLWLSFWAEGGDANILELEACVYHQMSLSAKDALYLGTAVELLKADLRESVSPRVSMPLL